MKQEKFGSNGPQVSVIGQGTWYLDRGDRKRAVVALLRGLELGMSHIDTAEMYGDAELVIADAIEGRRDEVFLVSKMVPSNGSRRGTITACERSLKRLKTDRLDCYLLHWRGSYPLSETVAAFDLSEHIFQHATTPSCHSICWQTCCVSLPAATTPQRGLVLVPHDPIGKTTLARASGASALPVHGG